jgi:ATP-dependent Zn protease
VAVRCVLQGRIAILKVHSRGKTLSKDVDFEKIARRTPGNSKPDVSATTVLRAVQMSILQPRLDQFSMG